MRIDALARTCLDRMTFILQLDYSFTIAGLSLAQGHAELGVWKGVSHSGVARVVSLGEQKRVWLGEGGG